MRKLWFAVLLAVLLSASAIAAVDPADNVDLEFGGTGSTLADTGFQSAYNLDEAGFNVAGGTLNIQTKPGDTFGQYETEVDPDSAKNMFYTLLNTGPGTTVDAKIHYTNLNSNFHGGGIWMGMDQDHYIRLGVIHNSYEGGIVVEALRENEDLWTERGGPGNDIMGRNSPKIADSWAPVDIYLRLVRDGSNATAWYSFDAVNYNQVDGVFDAIATGQTVGSTVEDANFKVGVYAFGGGTIEATVSFDYFKAAVVPEPGSLAALATGLTGLMGAVIRRRVS